MVEGKLEILIRAAKGSRAQGRPEEVLVVQRPGN
jgi:hypothetical protein